MTKSSGKIVASGLRLSLTCPYKAFLLHFPFLSLPHDPFPFPLRLGKWVASALSSASSLPLRCRLRFCFHSCLLTNIQAQFPVIIICLFLPVSLLLPSSCLFVSHPLIPSFHLSTVSYQVFQSKPLLFSFSFSFCLQSLCASPFHCLS